MRRMRGLIWLVAAAFFMQTRDSTIVNTAAPSIAHALAVRPINLKTALTSYVRRWPYASAPARGCQTVSAHAEYSPHRS